MPNTLTVAIGGLVVVNKTEGDAHLLSCDGHQPRLIVPFDLVTNRPGVAADTKAWMNSRALSASPGDIYVLPDGRTALSFELRDVFVTFPESGALESELDGTELDLDWLSNGAQMGDLRNGTRGVSAHAELRGGRLACVSSVGLDRNLRWSQESLSGTKRVERVAPALRLTKTLEDQTVPIEIRWGGAPLDRVRILLRIDLEGAPAVCVLSSHCPLDPNGETMGVLSDVLEYSQLYDRVSLVAPIDAGEMMTRGVPGCPPGVTGRARTDPGTRDSW